MVKHIVLFQFRSDVNEEQRKAARELFKSRIMALKPQLEIIKEIEVGFNVNPSEKWDICLLSSFDSLADVATYSAFPAHQAAAGDLKKLLQGRSCVDYEY